LFVCFYQASPNTDHPDPSDVSVSKSVSVVSVKYSSSGDRSKYNNQSTQLPDTSLPPPPIRQTTTTTPATTTTTTATKTTTTSATTISPSKIINVSTHSGSLTSTKRTTNLTTEVATERHQISEKESLGNSKPSSTAEPSTVLTSTLRPTTNAATTIRSTTTAKVSVTEKESHLNHVVETTTHSNNETLQSQTQTTNTQHIHPTTTTTIKSTLTTLPTSLNGRSSSKLESSTEKLDVPIINHPRNFEATENVRNENESRQEKTEEEFKVEETSTSTVRGEKALFASLESVNLNRNVFNSTLDARVTSTTSTSRQAIARPNQTTTTAATTITTTHFTTPTTSTKAHFTSTTTATTTRAYFTTTAPQKIYLQEVEEITDVEEPVETMERKALHSNVPSSRQLHQDDDEAKTGQANQQQETTEGNGKMIVEYLEESELARSFPSTKWNVYEDQVKF
jgi:hypothetical protein